MLNRRNNEVQLRTILSVIFKRKNQIFMLFSITVLAVVAATFLIKPLYEASAQILVTLGRGGLLFANMGDKAPDVYLDQENVINSEIEIIKSASIAEKVIKASGGAAAIFPEVRERAKFFKNQYEAQSAEDENQVELKKALPQFKRALRVEASKKSNLIKVSFRHSDARLSAEILNKLTSVYVDHHSTIRKTRKSYEFIQNQTELLRNRTQASGKEMESFKEQHDISNFDEQKNILLRQNAELQSILNQTAISKLEASEKSAGLRKILVSIPQNIPQAKQDDYNQQLLSNLQSRLVELELEEKNLSNKYTDDNRSLRNVREEIRIVRDKLSLQENKTYLRSTFGINPIYQNLQQDLIRYETEKKALFSKHEALAKQITVLGEKLTYLNRIELQYNHLKQQAESDRRNYDLYLTRLEESRISDAMDNEKISNISVVEPPSIPLRPVSPKPFLNISMAIVFGLFGGLAWAFFFEYLRDRIESTEDAESLLGLPVLTSIPLSKKAR